MVSSNDAEEVAVARRSSSVWTEIQRDRALRQRQSQRAERVHLKVERELKADAARIADGDIASIEDFARLAIERLSLPDGVALSPKAAYRPEPRELVVDIRLPDVAIVPIEKSVKYVKAHQTFTVNERSKTEMANIYRGILAQLPLCVLHSLFAAFRNDVVDSATVNGILPAVDRATGRPTERNLVSVTTSRAMFDLLVLDALELDPVLCVRELGAKLSPNPLAYEEVPPFLTFELAKYQLGPAVDVAAGLDGRTDLLTIDPFAFEQLVPRAAAGDERSGRTCNPPFA